MYSCEAGYTLQDPRISSLFCQQVGPVLQCCRQCCSAAVLRVQATWKGEMPRCVAEAAETGRVWCEETADTACQQLCYLQGEWGYVTRVDTCRHVMLAGGEQRCDCHPGYTLSEDGRTCDDVDECEVMLHVVTRGTRGPATLGIHVACCR